MIPLLVLPLVALSQSSSRTHRVVIEVNVPGPAAYRTVLGNVTNLKRAFGEEPLQVEVVCEGGGIEMLFANGKVAEKVTRAHSRSVRFVGCANTLRGRHLTKASLLPFVEITDSGVAEVVRRQEEGWSYLKGAF